MPSGLEHRVVTGCFAVQVWVGGMLFEDRGAALIRTVGQLPAVLNFELDYDWDSSHDQDVRVSDGSGLPRCQELAELHSRSLVRMRVCMLDGPSEDNMLRLSGLPELLECELEGQACQPTTFSLRTDAASFAGAPQLQMLSMSWLDALHLENGSLGQLTALTHLTLRGCGLRSVPADIASLRGSLRTLSMHDNHRMQIDAAALGTLVMCSQLEGLGLCKPDIDWWSDKFDGVWHRFEQHMSEEGYIPAQWSSESIRNLVQLPDTFRLRHGRTLKCYL